MPEPTRFPAFLRLLGERLLGHSDRYLGGATGGGVIAIVVLDTLVRFSRLSLTPTQILALVSIAAALGLSMARRSVQLEDLREDRPALLVTLPVSARSLAWLPVLETSVVLAVHAALGLLVFGLVPVIAPAAAPDNAGLLHGPWPEDVLLFLGATCWIAALDLGVAAWMELSLRRHFVESRILFGCAVGLVLHAFVVLSMAVVVVTEADGPVFYRLLASPASIALALALAAGAAFASPRLFQRRRSHLTADPAGAGEDPGSGPPDAGDAAARALPEDGLLRQEGEERQSGGPLWILVGAQLRYRGRWRFLLVGGLLLGWLLGLPLEPSDQAPIWGGLFFLAVLLARAGWLEIRWAEERLATWLLLPVSHRWVAAAQILPLLVVSTGLLLGAWASLLFAASGVPEESLYSVTAAHGFALFHALLAGWLAERLRFSPFLKLLVGGSLVGALILVAEQPLLETLEWARPTAVVFWNGAALLMALFDVWSFGRRESYLGADARRRQRSSKEAEQPPTTPPGRRPNDPSQSSSQ